MTRLAPRPTPDPDRSVDMLDRTDPVGELPIVILNPHSRCNCRCAMCDIWQVTTTQEIAPADIERWLPEWQRLGVRRVVFSGGEPLMHSALWQLCGPLHEAGIDITLLSTGLLLKRHAADLARFCDDVVVSLDGPREMHNRIRNVPRAYEKLAEGVAALRAAAPGVRVSGRCTVQRANYRHLRSTVSAAWDLRLDRISFLAVDVSSKAFNRPSGWPADRARSPWPMPTSRSWPTS
ncbi:MAG: radical SAM protein [Gemmatimonadales bacterium]